MAVDILDLLSAFYPFSTGSSPPVPPVPPTPVGYTVKWQWNRSSPIRFVWAYPVNGVGVPAFYQYGITYLATDANLKFESAQGNPLTDLSSAELECVIFKDDMALTITDDLITKSTTDDVTTVYVPFATDDPAFDPDGLIGDNWNVHLNMIDSGSRERLAVGVLSGAN